MGYDTLQTLSIICADLELMFPKGLSDLRRAGLPGAPTAVSAARRTSLPIALLAMSGDEQREMVQWHGLRRGQLRTLSVRAMEWHGQTSGKNLEGARWLSTNRAALRVLARGYDQHLAAWLGARWDDDIEYPVMGMYEDWRMAMRRFEADEGEDPKLLAITAIAADIGLQQAAASIYGPTLAAKQVVQCASAALNCGPLSGLSRLEHELVQRLLSDEMRMLARVLDRAIRRVAEYVLSEDGEQELASMRTGLALVRAARALPRVVE